MSVIFGLLKERGSLVTKLEMRHLSDPTDRYATGASAVYTVGRLAMGLQPYVSHERSAMEDRPRTDSHGHVLSFDGRLDNYKELATMLDPVSAEASDSEIVLSGFLRWGEACFSRLIGDWALALWSERDQTLFLARDHSGTKTLYWQRRQNRVWWSTYLDTFLTVGAQQHLSEDYVACYLVGGRSGS
jgi:asparagine synthase (glutamine-hydrolysing)